MQLNTAESNLWEAEKRTETLSVATVDITIQQAGNVIIANIADFLQTGLHKKDSLVVHIKY